MSNTTTNRIMTEPEWFNAAVRIPSIRTSVLMLVRGKEGYECTTGNYSNGIWYFSNGNRCNDDVKYWAYAPM